MLRTEAQHRVTRLPSPAPSTGDERCFRAAVLTLSPDEGAWKPIRGDEQALDALSVHVPAPPAPRTAGSTATAVVTVRPAAPRIRITLHFLTRLGLQVFESDGSGPALASFTLHSDMRAELLRSGARSRRSPPDQVSREGVLRSVTVVAAPAGAAVGRRNRPLSARRLWLHFHAGGQRRRVCGAGHLQRLRWPRCSPHMRPLRRGGHPAPGGPQRGQPRAAGRCGRRWQRRHAPQRPHRRRPSPAERGQAQAAA